MNALLKKRGAKLSRTETVTVRLDPKLRYLAELASRKQRRTLSSFIEWAIEDSLKRELVDHSEYSRTFFDVSEKLWDINESDRVVRLALDSPHLLSHEEQILWKFIKEFTAYDKISGCIQFCDESSGPDLNLIKSCWKELKGVVDGTVSESELKKAMCDNYIPF